MAAYAKNGTTPSQASERCLRPGTGPGRRTSPVTACVASGVGLADLGRPLGVDERLGLPLLAEARELHRAVEPAGRERLLERRRYPAPLHQVGEPGRMRIPLQPEDLPLVRVEELLPQPRCPRMRSSRVDGLAVVAAVLTVGRNRHLPVRRRELLHVGEVVVVPVDRDRRLARRDRCRSRLDRNEVANRLALCEPVDSGGDVRERASVRERCRKDTCERRAGRERAPVQGDLVLVLGLEQVGERLRRVLDEIPVVPDRDRADVVSHPEAPGVLHRPGNRLVVPRVVLRVEALTRALNRERRADVDDVRGTRIALEGDDRLVLLRRAPVGVVARDRDAVLLRERGDDRAVVRPVGRQRDHVQAALLLRLGHDLLEVGRGSPQRRGRKDLAACCERGRRQRHHRQPGAGGQTTLDERPAADPLLFEPAQELVLLLLIILHPILL